MQKSQNSGKRESPLGASEAGVRLAKGGDFTHSFFAEVYVDDYLLARVQEDPTDQTALIAQAALP